MNEQEQFEQEQRQQDEQSGQTEQSTQPEIAEMTEQAEQSEQTDNGIYTTPDVYQTQTAQEIYRTSEAGTEHHNTGGIFSGVQPENNAYVSSQPENNAYVSAQPESNAYVSAQPENNAYVSAQPENNAYVNAQPENNAYVNAQPENNAYGSAQPESNAYVSVQSENNAYVSAQPENNAYGSAQYENNPYGKRPYGSERSGNNAYGNNQNANNPYGNNQYGNNQYGNNPYGNPYASDPYGYNPYSPYAVPAQKKNTGLIIGVIVGIAALFLIAVFAVLYHAIEVASDKKETGRYDEDIDEFYRDYSEEDSPEDYFDDDNARRDDDYGRYDHNDDYGYDDYDDDYYDDDDDYDDYDDYNYDDDEYYTLHDDIKDLSYSIDWEYYDYDANGDNVIITVEYPVIVKGRIPNRDQINKVLESEIGFFTDYYENEYSKYMGDNNGYFYASAVAYVTYMSEDVLSVVFSEAVYSDYFDSISLYCVNIDVQNGVILDNTDIISVDDDFSVDFRYRSKVQNGNSDALDRMSDQEITKMLTSPGNLIIFYTPQGLEVGLNHEEGYITVTYHDYKDYLNTF